MLSLVLLAPVALRAPACSAQESDLRAGYDVRRYDLELEVDPEHEVLRGTVTVLAEVTAPELSRLELDAKAHLEIEQVALGGVELPFERPGDKIVAALPAAAKKGAALTAAVRYAGRMKTADAFDGFHWARTADGRPWINTSCQGTGSYDWWPCKDSFFHPEDKPDDGVRVAITVPADLYAVSNGRLAEITEPASGRRTFRWEHPYPLETYAVTLNVAPYVVVESELSLPGVEAKVPWIYYVLPENAEKAALQFKDVPELLAVYSEAFGPWPFPKSKFALVETNFWGMEHSTAVAYGSSYPAWCKLKGEDDPYEGRNRYFDYILVHEVAHEWWGNAVSASAWGHFWIHEGFGTYAEAVFLEKTQGRERADEYFARDARHIGKKSRLYRGDGVDSSEAYSGVIYSKGAAVLNTLRHYVADDDAWWRALREFNLRFRYGNAGTDDFRAVVEEITSKDWKRFFEEWVYGEGYPSLTGSVRHADGAIRVAIENTGSGATGFLVPLDLVWTDGRVPRSERLWIEPGPSEHEIPCAAAPTDLTVLHLERVLGRHDVKVE